ncbi:MAG: hypothetical protein IPK26_05525 [Planctomycetes bacterium]|nr:hypothetical protein [Planctomycetota bacterium]
MCSVRCNVHRRGEEVAKAHAAAGADWPCALAGEPVGGKLPLGAPQLPCCLLLDGDGKVLAASGSPLPLGEMLGKKDR